MNLEETILDCHPALYTQLCPMVFYQREEAKFPSPEVQCSYLAFHSPCCPKDLNLHCFMVTAAQPAFGLHIPHQLLVAEKIIQPSTFPLRLFYQLKRAVVISELPGIHALYCPEPPVGCHNPEVCVRFLVNSYLSQQGPHVYTVALIPEINLLFSYKKLANKLSNFYNKLSD